MKTTVAYTVGWLLVWPGTVFAQGEPVARLQAVLPPEIAEAVIAAVNDATARGLPGRAVADLALQAVARGRSGEEVLAAARGLVGELDASRFLLERGGRAAPGGGEVRAAAAVLRMGVDGATVSALARQAPSGRSLAVPLLVTGALVERGLPADAAAQAVLAGLQSRLGDAELASFPEAIGQAYAQGMSAAQLGLAIAQSRAPITIPVGGLGVPIGPPPGVPSNPGPPAGIPGGPGGFRPPGMPRIPGR